VGINNRNIASLELDSGGPSRTAALAAMAPKNALLISESGIMTSDDAKQAVMAGANAVLVGTALWQADDMAAAYGGLLCTLS
jgi:indole-3-glycerol phosphate synthase